MTRGGNRATSDIEKFMTARGVFARIGSRAAIKISAFENKLQKEGRKGERFFVGKKGRKLPTRLSTIHCILRRWTSHVEKRKKEKMATERKKEATSVTERRSPYRRV